MLLMTRSVHSPLAALHKGHQPPVLGNDGVRYVQHAADQPHGGRGSPPGAGLLRAGQNLQAAHSCGDANHAPYHNHQHLVNQRHRERGLHHRCPGQPQGGSAHCCPPEQRHRGDVVDSGAWQSTMTRVGQQVTDHWDVDGQKAVHVGYHGYPLPGLAPRHHCCPYASWNQHCNTDEEGGSHPQAYGAALLVRSMDWGEAEHPQKHNHQSTVHGQPQRGALHSVRVEGSAGRRLQDNQSRGQGEACLVKHVACLRQTGGVVMAVGVGHQEVESGYQQAQCHP
mmetsp:Transcript_31377/g.89023  ORF Transcript_31377/g.89023 Transcript_31377/m.89023 type:complete len:281 (-) Transcript_31377:2264-3106(-)